MIINVPVQTQSTHNWFIFLVIYATCNNISNFITCHKMGYWMYTENIQPLQWRHNERDSVSNHQTHDRLLNGISRCRSKKTSKLSVTCLCAGNSPVTGEFPEQRSSNAENVFVWWRHHDNLMCSRFPSQGANAVDLRFILGCGRIKLLSKLPSCLWFESMLM